MKHRINWDALVYSLLWALLAAVGFQVAGLKAGLLLSIGLFPIVIGVERSWKDARGAGSNAGILSYRLPAKTVFVPPPNPCAAALRGDLRRSDR